MDMQKQTIDENKLLLFQNFNFIRGAIYKLTMIVPQLSHKTEYDYYYKN